MINETKVKGYWQLDDLKGEFKFTSKKNIHGQRSFKLISLP